MRTAMTVVGAALIVVGAVWILQGIGTLKGSFMTGRAFWAWMGAAAVMLGLPLVVRGLRGRAGPRDGGP